MLVYQRVDKFQVCTRGWIIDLFAKKGVETPCSDQTKINMRSELNNASRLLVISRVTGYDTLIYFGLS